MGPPGLRGGIPVPTGALIGNMATELLDVVVTFQHRPLLTSEEASPLVICKSKRVAIREGRLCSMTPVIGEGKMDLERGVDEERFVFATFLKSSF